MANYEIYRYKKHKSKTSITHAINHNLRIGKQQSNVDITRSHKNSYSGLDTKAQCNSRRDSILSKLGKPPRSNAVLAHEVVVTASPDAFKDNNFNHVNYFSDAVKHIAELHGGVDNIVSVAIHLDEETPHLHVIIMPVVDGKLNSRAVIGGHSKRMSELQTLFHNAVGSKHGLKRGEIGSKTRHNPLTKSNKLISEREKQLSALNVEYKSQLSRSQALTTNIAEMESEVSRLIVLRERSESLTHEVVSLEYDVSELEEKKLRLESYNSLSVDNLRAKLDAEPEPEPERSYKPPFQGYF